MSESCLAPDIHQLSLTRKKNSFTQQYLQQTLLEYIYHIMDPSSSQNQQHSSDSCEARRTPQKLEEQCARYKQLPAVDQGAYIIEKLLAIQAQLEAIRNDIANSRSLLSMTSNTVGWDDGCNIAGVKVEERPKALGKESSSL